MQMIHVGLRLEQVTVDRVDELIESYSGIGVTATRSDVLRALIVAGLDARTRSEKKSERERAAVAKKAGAT